MFENIVIVLCDQPFSEIEALLRFRLSVIIICGAYLYTLLN